MLVYVDDVLVVGDGLKGIVDLKISLRHAFTIKDLGEI